MSPDGTKVRTSEESLTRKSGKHRCTTKQQQQHNRTVRGDKSRGTSRETWINADRTLILRTPHRISKDDIT